METIIKINGKETEGLTIGLISEAVQEGRAREVFKIHDVIELFDRKFEVIGFDHDQDAEIDGRHTMTVFEKEPSIQRRMHSGRCERGWIDTEMRKWLAEQYEELPDELKKAIRPVRKLTHNSQGKEYPTADKLFLASESELFGSAIFSRNKDEERYEAFDCSDDRVRRDADGDTCWFWSRSSRAGSSAGICDVGIGGDPGVGSAESTYIAVAPCFNF